MITYQVEKYMSCIDELKEIYPEHYEELGVTKEFPLDPNYQTYEQMDTLGMINLITVRDGRVLVGYILSMILPALHYKSCLTCVEDIYYLKKEYRKGRIGIKMFQFFEKEMLKLKVNRIVITTKIHLDNSKLFEYLGYTFFEKSFSKIIRI